MGTEQKEAQARSVGRQQLDVGLLEGQVSQDDGNLQHPLRLHVADTVVPRRVEEAVPALLARRTICGENSDKKNPSLCSSASGETFGVEIGMKGIYPCFVSHLQASSEMPGGLLLLLAVEFTLCRIALVPDQLPDFCVLHHLLPELHKHSS